MPLDPQAVADARREEFEFIRKLDLYEEVSVQDCLKHTGRPPISTKWVDILKGDSVRSRWVARDFKPKGEKYMADLFAAMPPLEAKRMLFRLFSIKSNQQGPKKLKLLFH